MVKTIQLVTFCSAAIVWQTPTYAAQSNDRFVFVGYGDVKYESADVAGTDSFSTRFVPIFLFNLNDKMHVEAELEVSINENGETQTELEYADIHYFVNNNTTITAGKFLLPFGQFSANWHPSWINRSIWTPGIYGAHGSSQAMDPMLPILSDIGIAAQQVYQVGSAKVFLDVFMTNGPSSEASHDEEEVDDDHNIALARLSSPANSLDPDTDGDEHTEAFPDVEFEATSSDNNSNKAFGGRLAVALLPSIEIGTSYYQGAYDENSQLDIKANGVDINFISTHLMVRGEYIRTKTEAFIEQDHEEVVNSLSRNGWFLQGTFFVGHLFEGLGSTEIVIERAQTKKVEEAERWMVGVNYWLDPRSVIKVGYEDTNVADGPDDKRFAVQFSYGF
jgi:hypothetical protein